MDKIFGHSWEDIQAMQQGTYNAPKIDLTKRPTIAATDNDMKLLAEHGEQGLREMKYYGVMDRLNISF